MARSTSPGSNARTRPPSSVANAPSQTPADRSASVGETAKAVLAHHSVDCQECHAGLANFEAGSEALRAMCPDGQAVMRDIVRLRLGREVLSPSLALVPVAS